MYVTQLLSLAFTFDQVKLGQMCFRMHIGLHAKAYEAAAWMLLQSFVYRMYIGMYQGLPEGAQLHPHLCGLALRPV